MSFRFTVQYVCLTTAIDRYSILPAIALSGVLHLDILTHPWTVEDFRTFVNLLLDRMNPYPLPNSVLVCDNASIHHFDELQDMVAAWYVQYLSR